MKKNPYPEIIVDETSGAKVPSEKHQIWEEGYQARDNSIKVVVKGGLGSVLVFNDKGEQMPEYQGQYEEVRERVLKDAPESAVFHHGLGGLVNREDW